jgi:hypothetical protein
MGESIDGEGSIVSPQACLRTPVPTIIRPLDENAETAVFRGGCELGLIHSQRTILLIEQRSVPDRP